jgi:uncharacterized protein (DUF1499 family)
MKLLRLLPVVALIGLVLLLIAGPGTRLGLWDFRSGFTLMRWALYFGGAGILLGVLAVLIPSVRRQRLTSLLLAIAIGLVTVTPIALQVQKARTLPFIHDVTTDTTNPPEFVAIAPLRADAPNPVEYGGDEVAEQQREGYPEIGPLTLEKGPDAVFPAAVDVVESMGWELVAADAAAGRIEATDTTFWFGFKDDVVIRIRAADGGSRVDIRSKSRVGGSDIGANAARIKRYLGELSDRAGSL